MKKKVVFALASASIIYFSHAEETSANTYTVQTGDTLSHIAAKLNISVEDLKRLNGLQSNIIFPLQTLKVSNPISLQKPQSLEMLSVKTYKVVKGDTLIKIARKTGVSLVDLIVWNNLKNDKISIGQMLKTSKPILSAPKPETKNPVASPVVNNAQTNPNVLVSPQTTPVTSSFDHIVKAGETLGKISIKYGIPVQELKTINKMTNDKIRVGQKLKIPTKTVAVPEKTEKPSTPPEKIGFSSLTLIEEAKKLLGTSYRYGGITPSGFDCSGFIYYVLNKSGKQIARHSSEGFYSRAYYVNLPAPGDLVFFANTYKRGISHMGIFLGNNKFIHASSTGVVISDLASGYYKKHFDGFKKFY